MQNHYLIVDTDIHPGVFNFRILDFLPEPWRTRYASGNRASGTMGYWNPGGVNCADAILDNDPRIEDNPQATSHYLLAAWNTDYGILNLSSLDYGLSPEAN